MAQSVITGKVIDTKEIKKLIAQGEFIETVTFVIDRYYQGKDLYTHQLYLKFENRLQQQDIQMLSASVVGDKVHAVWTVPRTIAQVQGETKIQIWASKIDSDTGDLVMRWTTFPARIYITSSLPPYDLELEDITVLEEYLAEMERIETETALQTAVYLEDADNTTEQYRHVFIPGVSSYSQLDGKTLKIRAVKNAAPWESGVFLNINNLGDCVIRFALSGAGSPPGWAVKEYIYEVSFVKDPLVWPNNGGYFKLESPRNQGEVYTISSGSPANTININMRNTESYRELARKPIFVRYFNSVPAMTDAVFQINSLDPAPLYFSTPDGMTRDVPENWIQPGQVFIVMFSSNRFVASEMVVGEATETKSGYVKMSNSVSEDDINAVTSHAVWEKFDAIQEATETESGLVKLTNTVSENNANAVTSHAVWSELNDLDAKSKAHIETSTDKYARKVSISNIESYADIEGVELAIKAAADGGVNTGTSTVTLEVNNLGPVKIVFPFSDGGMIKKARHWTKANLVYSVVYQSLPEPNFQLLTPAYQDGTTVYELSFDASNPNKMSTNISDITSYDQLLYQSINVMVTLDAPITAKTNPTFKVNGLEEKRLYFVTPQGIGEVIPAGWATFKQVLAVVYDGNDFIMSGINQLPGTTTRAGIVKLNNAINSSAETEAATPKAVKSVADQAAAGLQSISAKLTTTNTNLATTNTNLEATNTKLNTTTANLNVTMATLEDTVDTVESLSSDTLELRADVDAVELSVTSLTSVVDTRGKAYAASLVNGTTLRVTIPGVIAYSDVAGIPLNVYLDNHGARMEYPLFQINSLTPVSFILPGSEADVIGPGWAMAFQTFTVCYSAISQCFNVGGLNMPASIWTSATLLAASWSSATPPLITVQDSNIWARETVDIKCGALATSAQLEAYEKAKIRDHAQGEGTMTLKALGEKPAVDIPIEYILRRDSW